MPTTTNYGWTTPADTDLVSQGAAAMRTLGNGIDTTVKALNPETTLGDLAYRSSTSNTNTRLAIGSSGQVLTVSGGVPTWATPSSGAIALITRTAFSNVASQNFDSVFSSTYKTYLISIESIYGANAADDLLIGLRYGTTNATGHYGSQNKMPWNSSTITQTGTNNGSAWTIADIIGDSATPTTFQFFASNIGQGSSAPGIRGDGYMAYDNIHFVFGGGCGAQNFTGFRVLSSSGNIYGTVAVYGLKDA